MLCYYLKEAQTKIQASICNNVNDIFISVAFVKYFIVKLKIETECLDLHTLKIKGQVHYFGIVLVSNELPKSTGYYFQMHLDIPASSIKIRVNLDRFAALVMTKCRY